MCKIALCLEHTFEFNDIKKAVMLNIMVLIKDFDLVPLLNTHVVIWNNVQKLSLWLIEIYATHDKDLTIWSNSSDTLVKEQIIPVFLDLFPVKLEGVKCFCISQKSLIELIWRVLFCKSCFVIADHFFEFYYNETI